MRKLYKKLTEDQIKRNVVFSSTLCELSIETDGCYTHEVVKGQEDATEVINRLLNDKFFNKSHYKYNIIRR